MSAPSIEYSNGRFRCPLLNKSKYINWANAIKVQMIADQCSRVVDNHPPPPEASAHVNRDTAESLTENRRLKREYREDTEAHEPRSGATAAIIRATLTPIAESYVKGMTEPITMWNTLGEWLSPRDNVGRQQSLCMELELLTFNDNEDIDIYFEMPLDYQYNLEKTTLMISDSTLSSKVLSILPLPWRSQIGQFTDSGTATWESIEKFVRNIEAEQATTIPASWVLAISKKDGKHNKRPKPSDDNDKRSSLPPNPNIQCWYFARKGHTCNDCNFKKAADKLREKKDWKKQAAKAAATTNESTNEPTL